ncbi:MAG: hypothetical protein COA90_10055 [Gammaproteobacteria bacterium]|nr:MAG: hypothetical protein COA90_10055 [Gammaproteobacteria bacterium]
MKLISLTALLLLLLSGCGEESQGLGAGPLKADKNLNSPVLGMQVFQEGVSIEIKQSDINADGRTIIKLGKRPFLLSLPRHSDNDVFQVCIWTDDSIFKKVQAGLATEDVSFYSPGSGMAGGKTPYSTVFLDDIAHNYLYSDRIVRLETNRHGLAISTLGLNRKEYSISQQDGPLYAVIFIDINKNKVIDKNEFEKVVFEFDM